MNLTSPLFARGLGRAALVALSLGAAGSTVRADDAGSWLQTPGSRMVVGSGSARTESRPVSGFQAIALSGSMKLVLRQGAREALELRADDNLLPLIETRVVNRGGIGTLEIGMRRGTRVLRRSEMTVNVDVVALGALSVSGSGAVVCDALKTPALRVNLAGSSKIALRQLSTDDLALDIAGSGDVDFKGRTGRLKVSIAGSGDVNASQLEADEVTVDIAGSGEASVNAHKTLTVSIAGSGDVSYVGDAVVTRSIAGSGSVRKR